MKDSVKKIIQALKIKDDHSLDKDEDELLSLSLDIVKAYTDQLIVNDNSKTKRVRSVGRKPTGAQAIHAAIKAYLDNYRKLGRAGKALGPNRTTIRNHLEKFDKNWKELLDDHFEAIFRYSNLFADFCSGKLTDEEFRRLSKPFREQILLGSKEDFSPLKQAAIKRNDVMKAMNYPLSDKGRADLRVEDFYLLGDLLQSVKYFIMGRFENSNKFLRFVAILVGENEKIMTLARIISLPEPTLYLGRPTDDFFLTRKIIGN